MQTSSIYSLEKLVVGFEHRRRLVAQGEALPVVVNGDEIALELSSGNYTVLATSYDYFDGCCHWLYLLSEDGRPLDQLRMPDEFGFVQELDLVSETEFHLGYFGTNDRWRIQVSKSGFWSFKPAMLLKRPNRFLLAKRHLIASRTKGPPWSLPSGSRSSIASPSRKE